MEPPVTKCKCGLLVYASDLCQDCGKDYCFRCGTLGLGVCHECQIKSVKAKLGVIRREQTMARLYDQAHA